MRSLILNDSAFRGEDVAANVSESGASDTTLHDATMRDVFSPTRSATVAIRTLEPRKN